MEKQIPEPPHVLTVRLKSDLGRRFKSFCALDGITQQVAAYELIEKFVQEKEKKVCKKS